MASSRIIAAIIFLSFISFISSQEIQTAVVGEDKKLNLTCEEDATILITFSDAKAQIWSDNIGTDCANRNQWDTFWIGVAVIVKCQTKQSCSINLSNITMTNCTNFTDYLKVKYVCNSTESSTVSTTTENDSNEDDNSSEEKSTTTTTTTKKPPRGIMDPNYLPHVVPGLITTLKPTPKPNYLPQPLIPVPVLKPIPQPLPGPVLRVPQPPQFSLPKTFNAPSVWGGAGLGLGAGLYRPPIMMPIPVFG